MNEQLIGIFGGLIGSIITVIITKIIDLIQKKNEYTYDLKKQFFSKKLQAAESTIMQYTLFVDAINQLIILFERYHESHTEMGRNLNSNLLRQIEENISRANNSSLALSSAITLYFDLSSEYSEDKILKYPTGHEHILELSVGYYFCLGKSSSSLLAG